MMDQMGEVEYEVGEAKGTPWHPHRGFETVTYLIDGVFKHKDSNGGGGIIGNGDTQWMTAGSGILHIEAPTEAAVLKGGLFHGVQIWVNLPSSMKLIPSLIYGIKIFYVLINCFLSNFNLNFDKLYNTNLYMSIKF